MVGVVAGTDRIASALAMVSFDLMVMSFALFIKAKVGQAGEVLLTYLVREFLTYLVMLLMR